MIAMKNCGSDCSDNVCRLWQCLQWQCVQVLMMVKCVQVVTIVTMISSSDKFIEK